MVIAVFVWALFYRTVVPPAQRAADYLSDLYEVPPEQVQVINCVHNNCNAQVREKDGGVLNLQVGCGIIKCIIP